MPAGQRIAAEVDDVTAAAVKLLNDGVENAVEVSRQDLRRALRAQLVHEGLSKGSETGDVGEQRGAMDTLRQGQAGGKRGAPVTGDICRRPIRRDRRGKADGSARACAIDASTSLARQPC